jgi:hypothetical protein
MSESVFQALLTVSVGFCATQWTIYLVFICGDQYQSVSAGNISFRKCSKFGGRFWVWVHPNPDCGNRFISKKYFRLGGMAPSEWTRFVTAVRDTPVVYYSASRVNSTRRVPYCPLIAVAPFLLVQSVSNYKRSLGHCGQL